MSCVLLPVLEAQDLHLADISMRDITLMIAKRFLFIFALAIPFDIRDLFSDRQAGLKTIPVAWGEKNAYLFCQVLLAGISYSYSFSGTMALALIFLALPQPPY
jgi:4-hydroxybenzoate polyprenyltransferase